MAYKLIEATRAPSENDDFAHLANQVYDFRPNRDINGEVLTSNDGDFSHGTCAHVRLRMASAIVDSETPYR